MLNNESLSEKEENEKNSETNSKENEGKLLGKKRKKINFFI